ncbi:MAG: two-component system response regulator [Candidatus Hermodarchaeota archaeon]
MIPLILLVEDDPNILKYLKMTLEFNGCEVITANHGREGLKVLSELKVCPHLIISDIMMPEMNGYDFFNAVSRNPDCFHVPFIFLSALDSPEDIRLGKMLGVDDYLTKPINEEDLLSIVFGKIKRNQTINEIYSSYQIEKESIPEVHKDLIILVEVHWDDIYGPKLINNYPNDLELNFSLSNVSQQLYDGSIAMYGQDHILNADGFLIPRKNVNVMAYVFFDSYPDDSFRGGRKNYMFSLIASKITYLQSLEIKNVFIKLSSIFKKQGKWDIKEYWSNLYDILKKN